MSFLAWLFDTDNVMLPSSNNVGDWRPIDGWETPRSLDQSGEFDPLDDRVQYAGTGQVDFEDGIATFVGKAPRLYIYADESSEGWENVAMTGYGRFVVDGNLRPWSGLTMVARTNYNVLDEDPCQAFGYYARVYRETGECAFQKQYYQGDQTIFTPTNRVPCLPPLAATSQTPSPWIGMKFVVHTIPEEDSVQLQLYLDLTDSDTYQQYYASNGNAVLDASQVSPDGDSGNWVLAHSIVDSQGSWISTKKTIPSECPQANGDVISGPKQICFFRTDGSETTTVQWRNASIHNLSATSLPTASPTSNPTTASPTFSPTSANPTSSPTTASPTTSGSTEISNTGDWGLIDGWETQRSLDQSGEFDPLDDRVQYAGTGQVDFENGIATFVGKAPRLYIYADESSEGWENVAMTGYGRFVVDGNLRPWSGLTMVARTNYNVLDEDPCQAFSYYARVYRETGECAFQKQYYQGDQTIFTPTNRVPCLPPLATTSQTPSPWIGMKFVVHTIPEEDSVQLQLYLDLSDSDTYQQYYASNGNAVLDASQVSPDADSGNWVLAHSIVDSQGSWISTKKTIPSECPQANGDVISGPKQICFFRTDGSETTTVQWRNASIKNLPATSTSSSVSITLSPTGSPTTLGPTGSPTTLSPTGSPTTASPTGSPTTVSPTGSPTTISPTGSPTTVSPTLSPTGSSSNQISNQNDAAATSNNGDWRPIDGWETQRSLDQSGAFHPLDDRVQLRGTGRVDFEGGIATFVGKAPRLYIYADESSEGWENVAMTGYGRFVVDGNLRPWSGLTMVARTNHQVFDDDPCQAFGYYARVYRETGECAFQKEYYHELKGQTVYTPTNRVPCLPPLAATSQTPSPWIGMKFVVHTIPEEDSVQLQLYLDLTDSDTYQQYYASNGNAVLYASQVSPDGDSGNWVLAHSIVDSQGSWISTKKTIPSECPQRNGDVILGPRQVSYFRTDGSETTTVQWRNASIKNLPATSSSNTGGDNSWPYFLRGRN